MAAFSPNCIKSQFTRQFSFLFSILQSLRFESLLILLVPLTKSWFEKKKCDGWRFSNSCFHRDWLNDDRYLRLGHLFAGRRLVPFPYLFGRVCSAFRSVSSVASHLSESVGFSWVSPRQTWVDRNLHLPILARLFWLVVSAIDKIGRRSSSCVSVSTTETDEMMTTSVTIFFVSPHAHAHAVINGEKAAFNTPIFSQKRERTLDMLIRDMYAEVMTEHRGVSSSSSWPSIVASVFHNKSREKMKRHFPAIQKNRSIFDDCVILFLNMDWIFE